MSVTERRKFIQEQGRCRNCLYGKHFADSCTSRFNCNQCRKRHHTLLHETIESQGENIITRTTVAEIAPKLSTQSTTVNSDITVSNVTSQFPEKMSCKPALLPTARVLIKTASGKTTNCRILLDSGSQASLISKKLFNKLQICAQKTRICISGIATSGIVARGMCEIEMVSMYDPKNTIKVQVLILDKLTAPLPAAQFDTTAWEYLENLDLADPDFDKPNDIDVLVGADYFFQIIQNGKISGSPGSPIAQETIFGWVVTGQTKGSTTAENPIIRKGRKK